MRWIWWAAMLAGISYYGAAWLDVPDALAAVWKGAGVGLLALWAAGQADSDDGWLLALVLACGAAGDVLLEVAGLSVGAVAFLAGHLVAIVLYVRNRRASPSISQRAAALALLVGTPAIAWLLSRDAGAGIYALGLGAMAAAAWISRFPRYRVGLGAVMFVASDLLIFARIGSLADADWPGLLIWPLYFGGQALIATAVVRMLRLQASAPDPTAAAS